MAYLHCDCGFKKENIPDAHVGKKAKCPKCKQSVPIKKTIAESKVESNTIEKNGIKKWLKCPGCGAMFLPGTDHHIGDAGTAKEERQHAIPYEKSGKSNKTLIAAIGIGLIVVVTTFILFMSGPKLLDILSSKASSPSTFSDFIVRFFLDEEFQYAHIHFPLEYNYIEDGEDGPEDKTKYMPKDEWDFDDLSWLNEGCCNVIYSLNLENPEYENSMSAEKFYQSIQESSANIEKFFDEISKEYVIGILGKESGISEFYHFKFSNNNWMLVKYDSLSM